MGKIGLLQSTQLEYPRLFPRKILEEDDWQSHYRVQKSPIAVSMGEIGLLQSTQLENPRLFLWKIFGEDD